MNLKGKQQKPPKNQKKNIKKIPKKQKKKKNQKQLFFVSVKKNHVYHRLRVRGSMDPKYFPPWFIRFDLINSLTPVRG